MVGRSLVNELEYKDCGHCRKIRYNTAMSTSIHPYLIARLLAVQEAFGQPGFRPMMANNMPTHAIAPPKRQNNNWKEILKDEDEDDKGGDQGGGGTMKGHRGKNAEHAKQAMRKLTRR